MFDFKGCYEKMIKDDERDIESFREMIEMENSRIKRIRKEDREHAEWVWNHYRVLTKEQMERYGNGKEYQSPEMKKALSDRSRWYRWIKKTEKHMEKYRKELAKLTNA